MTRLFAGALAIAFLIAPTANAGIGDYLGPELQPQPDALTPSGFMACLISLGMTQCVQNVIACAGDTACITDYVVPTPCTPNPAAPTGCLPPVAPPAGVPPCTPDPAAPTTCLPTGVPPEGVLPCTPNPAAPTGCVPEGVPPGGVPGVPPLPGNPAVACIQAANANPQAIAACASAPPSPATPLDPIVACAQGASGDPNALAACANAPEAPSLEWVFAASDTLSFRSVFDDGSRLVNFTATSRLQEDLAALQGGSGAQNGAGVRFNVEIKNIGATPVTKFRLSIPGAFPMAEDSVEGWELASPFDPPSTTISPVETPRGVFTHLDYEANGTALPPGGTLTVRPRVLGAFAPGLNEIYAAVPDATGDWLVQTPHSPLTPRYFHKFLVLAATDLGFDVRDEDGDVVAGPNFVKVRVWGPLAVNGGSAQPAGATVEDTPGTSGNETDGLVLIPRNLPPAALQRFTDLVTKCASPNTPDPGACVQENATDISELNVHWEAGASSVLQQRGSTTWPELLEKGTGFLVTIRFPFKLTIRDELGHPLVVAGENVRWATEVADWSKASSDSPGTNVHFWTADMLDPRNFNLSIAAAGFIDANITQNGNLWLDQVNPPVEQVHLHLGAFAPLAAPILKASGLIEAKGLEYPFATGRIEDEAGAVPYEHDAADALALVNAANPTEAYAAFFSDASGADRYYAAVPAGAYDVTLTHPGYLPARVANVPVSLSTARVLVDLVGENGLRYPARLGQVEAELAPAGGALPGDEITIAGAEVIAGQFIRAAPGEYTATLTREGYLPAATSFTLAEGATEPVTVDFSGDSKLLANVRVSSVTDQLGNTIALADVAFTLEGGEPLARGLVDGAYLIAAPDSATHVVASTPGFLPARIAIPEDGSEIAFTDLLYTVRVPAVQNELGTAVTGVTFSANGEDLVTPLENGVYYVPHPSADVDLVATAPGFVPVAFNVPASAEPVVVEFTPAAASGSDADGLPYRLKIIVTDEIGNALAGATLVDSDGEAVNAVAVANALYVAAGDGGGALSLALVAGKAGFLDTEFTAAGDAGEQALAEVELLYPVTFEVSDIFAIPVASLDGMTFARGDDPSTQTAIVPDATNGNVAYFTQNANDQWYTIEKAGYRGVGHRAVLSEGSSRGVFVPLEHNVRVIVGAASATATLDTEDVTFTRDGAAAAPDLWIGTEAFFADADAALATYRVAAPGFVRAAFTVPEQGLASAIAPLVPTSSLSIADEIGGAIADATASASTTAPRNAAWTIAVAAPGMIGDSESATLAIGEAASLAFVLAYPIHIQATFLGSSVDLEAALAEFARGAGGEMVGIDADALDGETAYFRALGDGETYSFIVQVAGMLDGEIEDDPADASRHYTAVLSPLLGVRVFNASLSAAEGAIAGSSVTFTRADASTITIVDGSSADADGLADGKVVLSESLAGFANPVPIRGAASGYLAKTGTAAWSEESLSIVDHGLDVIVGEPTSFRVSGVVRALTGSAAIAGATITITDGASSTFTGTTDSSGAYAITDVPAGAYSISAAATGFVAGGRNLVVDGDEVADFSLESAPAQRLTVTLTPPTIVASGDSFTLRVTVTDATGAPVEAARVDATSILSTLGVQLTNAEGVVDLSAPIPAIGSYAITVVKSTVGAPDLSPWEYEGAATFTVTEFPPLPDPTSAANVVYRAVGCPEACALVLSSGTALAYGAVADLLVTNLTGAVGDEWLLTAATSETSASALAIADPDHPGRVALAFPATAITGGESPAGGKFNRAGAWALAGPDASATLTVLPASTLALTLAPSSFEGPADGSITGTVTVRNAAGEPVEGARVVLTEMGFGALALTLADGTYLFNVEVPESGTYTIRATKDVGGSTDPEIIGAATFTVTRTTGEPDECQSATPPPECEGGPDCESATPPPGCEPEPGPVFAVQFTFAPTAPRATEGVTFTSTAAHGLPATWSWSFGDGTIGSGASVTHAYNTQGSFTVRLTATTAAGATATFEHVLTIAAAPAPPASGDVPGGCSGFNCDGNGNTPSVPLAQPSTPAVRVVTTSSVAVSWTTTGEGQSSVEYGVVEPFSLTTGTLPNGAASLVEISGLTPGKTYGFVVKATNKIGTISRSSTTWVTMPTQIAATAPEITFLSPADGADVRAPTQISVLVADADGVKVARLILDGVKVAETTGSLSFAWADPAPGPHTIRVEAQDSLGATSAKSIRVNGPAIPTLPTPETPPTPPTSAPQLDPGVIVSVPATVSTADGEIRAMVRTVDLGSSPTITFLVDDFPANARKEGDAWIVTLPTLTPGSHQMQVRAVAATGENAGARTTFTVAEPIEPASGETPAPEPEIESKRGFLGIPGPGLGVALGLLAAVAIALRRRGA